MAEQYVRETVPDADLQEFLIYSTYLDYIVVRRGLNVPL